MRRCAVLALLLSTPALAVALSVQLRPVGPIYTRQMLRPPVVMHAQQQSGLSNGHEHSNGVVREPEPKLSPLLNLPNMLTIARVAMVPFMQVQGQKRGREKCCIGKWCPELMGCASTGAVLLGESVAQCCLRGPLLPRGRHGLLGWLLGCVGPPLPADEVCGEPG
eukprot:scaffold3273_cov244-Pinguiococcus_pyrenoidosus.AAC.3